MSCKLLSNIQEGTFNITTRSSEAFGNSNKKANEKILCSSSGIHSLDINAEAEMFCSEFSSIMLLKSLNYLNQSLINLIIDYSYDIGDSEFVNFPIKLDEDVSILSPNALYVRICDYYIPIIPPKELTWLIRYDD